MLKQKSKTLLKCSHQKTALFAIKTKIFLCLNCSTIIFRNEHNKEISTIKPSKYSLLLENAPPLLLSIQDNHSPYFFLNKIAYQKVRILIVKKIKIICSKFKLSKKTYFLALDYFDRICSKMTAFDIDDLSQISQFCIILASKFQENQVKGMEIKLNLGLTNNYSNDELYLLQLLDYDLYAYTSYDIMMDIMQTGFLFNDEKFSLKKMNLIYGKMENMLYFFSETKYYIDMTPKEISLAIIGLIRETLGLISYNKIIKIVFMNENTDIENYLSCIKKLRKCFKIKDDEKYNNNNNNSDSTTDSNSDNSSGYNSENSLELNSNKNNAKISVSENN